MSFPPTMYVGGLPNNVTKEEIKLQFNNCDQINIHDSDDNNITSSRRNFTFALITFRDESDLDNNLTKKCCIQENICEVRRAQTSAGGKLL